MRRRTVLATLAAGTVSGCLGRFVEENCGPGSDSIAEVVEDFQEDQFVRIKGEVRWVGDDFGDFELADTTGIALVLSGVNHLDGEPEGCLQVTGTTVEAPGGPDTNHLVLFPRNVREP